MRGRGLLEVYGGLVDTTELEDVSDAFAGSATGVAWLGEMK